MFLVRSAFWLTAAFIVMAPGVGMDVGASVRSGGEHLVSQGAQMVGDTLLPASCTAIECVVGRSIIGHVAESGETVSVLPEAIADVPDAHAAFPPPRPDWAY